MIRATAVIGQYNWIEAAIDTVVLDFDDRHRRRMVMTGTRGLEFLLDLENAVALRGGDALVLEDGRRVEVVAAPEPLIEIRGTDPGHLVRLAWHLGNRHLPTQIMAKGLRIRRDHVIEEMVKGLGARVIEIEAPFDPEGGAYAPAHQSHAHHDHAHHDHGHRSCSHDHDHHGHAHGKHDHGHVHDEHCGHDHDHGHHHHGHSHAHGHK
ncbi:urease accessory protein UreE [Rhodopseudomonas boonkerdii]|uniref:urease accessory protein UreE n=1 Tax=Rhodopseudomonas boonkerdii TaxID=475937 RepID=UPI001E3FAD2A|nr:urease accessory protein UreE [Rhodopseudomonas boonkerdii]UGV27985.1 urease accessory protein UreE [Rhodopseudomonas boonkerdii]